MEVISPSCTLRGLLQWRALSHRCGARLKQASPEMGTPEFPDVREPAETSGVCLDLLFNTDLEEQKNTDLV